MSLQIITAVRHLAQLKGSLKLTAIELAHRASSSGHARVSYWFLAKKTGLSIKTMIRHVHRLVSMGIVRKQTVRLTLTRFAVNAYTFLISPIQLHKCSTPKVGETLPEPEREKKMSLLQEIETLKKGMRFLTEATIPWQASMEKLARLEALLTIDRKDT